MNGKVYTQKNFWKIYFTLIILYLIVGIYILKFPIIITNIVALTFGIIGYLYRVINKSKK